MTPDTFERRVTDIAQNMDHYARLLQDAFHARHQSYTVRVTGGWFIAEDEGGAQVGKARAADLVRSGIEGTVAQIIDQQAGPLPFEFPVDNPDGPA